jgi:hypothetical protein
VATKEFYEAVAYDFRDIRGDVHRVAKLSERNLVDAVLEDLAKQLAKHFAADDPEFNPEEFLSATSGTRHDLSARLRLGARTRQ